jgi:hypothetical protein
MCAAKASRSALHAVFEIRGDIGIVAREMNVIENDIYDVLDFPGRGVQLTLGVGRIRDSQRKQPRAKSGNEQAGETVFLYALRFLPHKF